MKKGIGIFGKQYEIGYKNDIHADGSVDRVLFEQMIRLDNDSVEYLYNSYTDLFNRYKSGNRAYFENIVSTLKGQTDVNTVDNIISYCKNIVENCDTETEDFIFGGTEEEIVKRGTYWCTDIARVACIMFQIAGFPSRIIITANTKFAYCGHIVTEVYYNGKWGVTDPTNGVVIRHHDGVPASAWEIHQNPDITNQMGEQYESVGISNYYIDERNKYIYETSKVNDYYREILKHSDEKWAGGIRWIHDEDLISERIEYWLDLADYDIETATAMQQTGRYLYVGFMCHQAIEKSLKAIIAGDCIDGDIPPKIHDLSKLAIRAKIFDSMSDTQKDFIEDVNPLNIEARYPDYKNSLALKLTKPYCQNLIKETEELLCWIKARL